MVESISELRKICQTKYRRISRSEFIHRAISIYITKLVLGTSISANQITVLDFVVGLVAVILISFTNIFITFAGLFLLLLWAVLDCVDGEVARYRGTVSVMGQYLDCLSSTAIVPVLFMSLTFRLYGAFHDITVFIFGFSASLGHLLFLLIAYNMYVSAGKIHIRSKKLGIPPKEIGYTGDVGIDKIQSQVNSTSHFVYDIINFFLPGPATGFPFIITATFIFDSVIPRVAVGHFVFNSLYLCLAAYGVLMPITCLVLTYTIIKDDLPEKLSLSLFGRNETT